MYQEDHWLQKTKCDGLHCFLLTLHEKAAYIYASVYELYSLNYKKKSGIRYRHYHI